jgi:hypothetical protein
LREACLKAASTSFVIESAEGFLRIIFIPSVLN